MTAEPSKRKEIIKDKQFLSSQKLGANEADIEKIKIQFMAIVRDIKSGMQKKRTNKSGCYSRSRTDDPECIA